METNFGKAQDWTGSAKPWWQVTPDDLAGIINPPGGKGAYWINEFGKPAATAEEWRESAAAHQGSWWTDWFAWLAKQSGKKVKPSALGSEQYPVLQDAPGSYVLEK